MATENECYTACSYRSEREIERELTEPREPPLMRGQRETTRLSLWQGFCEYLSACSTWRQTGRERDVYVFIEAVGERSSN